jgi:hypothetical protein
VLALQRPRAAVYRIGYIYPINRETTSNDCEFGNWVFCLNSKVNPNPAVDPIEVSEDGLLLIAGWTEFDLIWLARTGAN